MGFGAFSTGRCTRPSVDSALGRRHQDAANVRTVGSFSAAHAPAALWPTTRTSSASGRTSRRASVGRVRGLKAFSRLQLQSLSNVERPSEARSGEVSAHLRAIEQFLGKTFTQNMSTLIVFSPGNMSR